MSGKISEDPDVGTITGIELIPVVSRGTNMRTTPAEILTYVSASSSVTNLAPRRILASAARIYNVPVLASPITPVVGANFAASTLTSPQTFHPTDSVFSQVCGNILFASAGVYTGQFVDNGGASRQGGSGEGLRFGTDSANVEFQISDGGGPNTIQVRVQNVNGAVFRATAADIGTGQTNFGMYRIKLPFGSQAPRIIEIYGGNAGFYCNELCIDGNTGQRIWAAPPIGEPLIMVFGDSYTVGTGATSCKTGFAHVLGDILGVHVIGSGNGGTGYTIGGKTFGQRVADAALFGQPDLIVVAGGANDGAASPSALTAAVTSFLTALRALCPNTLIMVLGPWQFPTLGATSTTDAAITAGFNAAADNRMFKVNSFGWLDPSGGNSTGVYLSGTVPGHPNDAGHAYLGRQVADQVITWMKTFG